MTTILELADRMWEGEADLVHEHHPVQYRHPQAEEIAAGVLVYIGIASAQRHRHRRRARDARHRRPVRQRPRSTTQVRAWRPDARCAPRSTATTTSTTSSAPGGSRPRRPRRGGRRRSCTPTRSSPTTSAATSARSGWNSGDQPAPVRDLPVDKFTWPDCVPLPRRHLPRPPHVHARRPDVRAAPRPRRDRRRHVDVGARS